MNEKSSKIIESREPPELTAAISEIRNLNNAKAEAEAHIADCIRHLDSEKALLNSLLSQTVTPENTQYMKDAKRACRLGIKAWKLSIEAYQADIDAYNAEVVGILKCTPEARIDH